MKQVLPDITLLTAAFNRHEVTLGMLRTFDLASKYAMPIVIIDNSTTTPLQLSSTTDVFRIIDNTNFKHTGNYHQVSKNHCSSLQYAIENINTKYIMLCDNDILFYPAINDLLETYRKFDAIGEIGWDVTPPDRLFPYLCIFDAEKMKRSGISYFDNNRCMSGNARLAKLFRGRPGTGYMDTGYSFLADITSNGWNIHKIKVETYCHHIKGVSLKNKMNYSDIYAKHVMEM